MNLWAAFAPPRAPEPIPEEWLEPGLIAGQLGIGEAYCRKLINRGRTRRLPGFKKLGGRLYATVEAVKDIRPIGAFHL